MSCEVNLRKELRFLAGPIFVEVLLMMTLGAMDTIMLSQFDDNAVAAVGVVNQLIMFSLLVFAVINVGTSVLCSQYIGARQQEKVVQVTGVALILNTLMGFVVSAMLYTGAPALLELMGLRPELMHYGVNYMKIVGGLLFFQAISQPISASLRAADKAYYPMMVIVVVNILNIIGNYSLIFGKFGMPALGVEGAAISTCFSRFVSLILLVYILLRKHIHHFPLRLFYPFPWAELKNLLKIGLPSAGENMSYDMQQIVITYFINMLGNNELATRTYVVNIVMFVYLFCIAVAQGGAIVIGHLVGDHKIHAAYLMGRYVMKWALIVTLTLSVIWAVNGRLAFSLLTDNPEIISMGTMILWLDVLLETGRVINIYATNALRSAGDVNYPFYVGIIVQWGVGVLLGYVLGIHFAWGIAGMWIAFMLDENIRGFIFVKRWNSMKWAKKGFVK
ncbi:MAG: MATE family efflux transporter [Bacteroidaceae bacterium]|nr:MATE family efflux transporter [Bacteroidaceae bacterium]MCF0185604.1 MATE family efflux transporter [Bacteroidaceae bacterium]